MLAGLLGALAIAQAGPLSSLAVVGLVACELLVGLATVTGWGQCSGACVALLAGLFVAGGGSAALLAPAYGAGMLLVGELVAHATQLHDVGSYTDGAVSRRVARTGIGCGLAAIAAAGVSLATWPDAGRTVALTATGAVAGVGCLVIILCLARGLRRLGQSDGESS